jgi:hypothetical protein
MPELPWEKWYPSNWASEPGLRLCEAATRGIWFEAVNTMMLKETDHISGTIEQLASLCICRTSQMQLAISQLKDYGVAEVMMQNECITIANRRRKRLVNTSEARRNAANSRWKRDANTLQTSHANGYAPSASAYASASENGGMQRGKDFEFVRGQLNEIFKRNGRPWNYGEEFKLSELCRRPTVTAELKRIIGLRVRMTADDRRYFPRSIERVLERWDALLDTEAIYQPPQTPDERRAMDAALARWK